MARRRKSRLPSIGSLLAVATAFFVLGQLGKSAARGAGDAAITILERKVWSLFDSWIAAYVPTKDFEDSARAGLVDVLATATGLGGARAAQRFTAWIANYDEGAQLKPADINSVTRSLSGFSGGGATGRW